MSDAIEHAFLAVPIRRQLRAYCYRMLGSFADAEDAVQETLLRAWRGREGFEGRASLRTWLYRIATNVCLNLLERAPRRMLPPDMAPAITAATPASEARATPPRAAEIPWLTPFPDEPEAALASRESTGLVFLAALQHLPPRQRAVLVLADVVGMSAREVAGALELTVAAVTSALQRAHDTMRARLPDARGAATADERAALAIFMAAWEQGDVAELTRILREDARWAMPPAPLWFEGRAAIVNVLTLYPPRWQGRSFRMLPTAANGQPAAAAYLRTAGDTVHRLTGVHVLRVEGAEIADITTFSAELCAGFRLPPTL